MTVEFSAFLALRVSVSGQTDDSHQWGVSAAQSSNLWGLSRSEIRQSQHVLTANLIVTLQSHEEPALHKLQVPEAAVISQYGLLGVTFVLLVLEV
ncbi:hypothetical protein RRG08_020092 [Elysia crispata]|uniref:Uncharacterized protein n=1 Tax=Elysia crispata TaxID=231223 RepID=A0AAE1A651_9GAST|nr:hypothetical protein RRG08_020092 [Elysia crispata]